MAGRDAWTSALVLSALSAISAGGSPVVDWPDDMTIAEVAARTNVHDGYVIHALPLATSPVERRQTVTASQSTLDYTVGYSRTLGKWLPLREGRVPKGLAQVGVRATLRAVQAGGENWQVVLRGPNGRVKRLFPTAYQPMGPGGAFDCFGDYLTQRHQCQSRTAQVLWFVDAACLQPGAWTFALHDEPSGGDHDVAQLTVTVPGKPQPGTRDPCEVKPTPVTEHDQNPTERAFQMLAQRELAFSRAGVTSSGPSLVIQLVSRGHLLLADNQGRRTGLDAAASAIVERIPRSSYRDSPVPAAFMRDPHALPIRSLAVARPESGEYVLTVHGTEGEPYWLSVSTVQDPGAITLIQTDPHVSSDIAYRIRVNASDLRQLHVLGGFDGEGRSRGSDRLMTFGSPTNTRTDLPLGTNGTDLLVFYAAGIEPDSFRARLNDKAVSSRFHPYKSWREVVHIPLVPGDNRLDLSIKGTIDSKQRTEKVRLTFAVPK